MITASTKNTSETTKCRGSDEFIKLAESVQEKQNKCRGCKGLSECKQLPHGFIPVAERKYGQVYVSYSICKYERQERAQRAVERRFSRAGIPERYKEKNMTDYRVNELNEKAVKLAKYVTDNVEGAYFYGANGTGKTLLVSLIAISKMNKGEQVLFISVPELIAELRNAMNRGEEVNKLDIAKAADCLILDDLGSERMTEWVGAQIFRILDYRLNHSLQTIITSNYSPTEIAKRLAVNDSDDVQGRRIMSRIYGLCEPAKLDGKDGRLNGRASHQR